MINVVNSIAISSPKSYPSDSPSLSIEDVADVAVLYFNFIAMKLVAVAKSVTVYALITRVFVTSDWHRTIYWTGQLASIEHVVFPLLRAMGEVAKLEALKGLKGVGQAGESVRQEIVKKAQEMGPAIMGARMIACNTLYHGVQWLHGSVQATETWEHCMGIIPPLRTM